MLKRKMEASPVLRENRKGDVLYFTFPSLEETAIVIHGFSSRYGGVSEREFAAMNLSFSRGDDPERVRENYRRLAAAIGFSPRWLVFTHQTHTTNVREATEADCGKGFSRERDYTDVDGLVTNRPGIVLAAFFADCVPLFFVDPVKRAIGLSHSGWRGTVHDIAGVTVKKMHDLYGCDPADLIAGVGPSICQDCYEVSEDVIEEFKANYPAELWPLLFEEQERYRGKGTAPDMDSENKEGLFHAGIRNEAAGFTAPVETPSGRKYQLNLWEACRQNLLCAGLAPEHISVTDVCTCCNPELLFSHRASHGKRGNLGAFLMLKD